MENEPAQNQHQGTRQQRTETFVDAFVQLAAVSSRPLRQLIDEAVADVPHLWRRRLADGQSPADILHDLAAMLAACAQLAPAD